MVYYIWHNTAEAFRACFDYYPLHHECGTSPDNWACNESHWLISPAYPWTGKW